MDEEEDTPILEIPVHISKRLSDHLYLFQYLDKFPNTDFNKMMIGKCAVKPNNQEVKIEVSLDTNSKNYENSKGEEIAVKADGMQSFIVDGKKEEKRFFDSDVMDKYNIVTTKAIDDCSTYAIGMLTQNEVHLTPLKGILQLRTSLEYLDKSDKRTQKSKKQAMSDKEDTEDEEKETEEEQVMVRFARTESDKTKKAREQSFAHYSKKSAEEPWISTTWHHLDTCEAELEKMHLSSTQTQDVGHSLAVNAELYTERLVPPQNKLHESLLPTESSVSLSSLKKLSLVEQCKTLLKDAKILSFDKLLSLLCYDITKKEEILSTLPHAGVLVKGVWVVRSELLYPPNTLSATCGVPSESMCRARDYILYLFTHADFVNRRKVALSVKLPAEELKEIFTGIARHQNHKGWELLLPPDETFIQRHPDIVQRQKLMWETKVKQFSEFLRDPNKPVRQRKKSNRDSVGSDMDVPKVNGVYKRDNSMSSDTDSGTERNKKSPVIMRKRTKRNNSNVFVGNSEPLMNE